MRRRLFDGLLVAEIALALVVVTGAILMTRTMYTIANIDPGFQSDHVLTMRLDLGREYVSVAKQESFRRDVLTNIKAIPGVESAAFTTRCRSKDCNGDRYLLLEISLYRSARNFRTPPSIPSALNTSKQ